MAQLSEEARKTQELHARLSAIEQQSDQLQGELALALQQQKSGGGSEHASPVQLERVVVSNAEPSALSGRVLSINRDWHFVVIDLGWDAVRIGDTVSIFRGDQLLAKARIERVQEGVCAATVLPEWETIEIRINDLVRVL